jgi:hypothetical protein
MERRDFFSTVAGLSTALALTPALIPSTSNAQQPTSALTLPVTGTSSDNRTFVGRFTPQQFLQSGGQLVARGLLAGALVNAAGVRTPISGQTVQLPVSTFQQANCTILDLTLGPLDLNLLGLEIHLNQVHLVIEANPSGGLLGQLLCGIANLLSGGQPLQQLLGRLVDLLNQLLAVFG